MFLLLSLFVAQTGTAHAQLVCWVKPGDEGADAFRRSAEEDPLFGLATQSLGAATACKQEWSEYEKQRFRKITYTFKGGTFSSQTSPPETSVTELLLTKGALDEKKALAVLARAAVATNVKIDWKKAPEKTEANDRTTREIWWDPAPGLNAGGDLMRRKGAVIGVRFHIAL